MESPHFLATPLDSMAGIRALAFLFFPLRGSPSVAQERCAWVILHKM
jgi:hypothetical protein